MAGVVAPVAELMNLEDASGVDNTPSAEDSEMLDVVVQSADQEIVSKVSVVASKKRKIEEQHEESVVDGNKKARNDDEDGCHDNADELKQTHDSNHNTARDSDVVGGKLPTAVVVNGENSVGEPEKGIEQNGHMETTSSNGGCARDNSSRDEGKPAETVCIASNDASCAEASGAEKLGGNKSEDSGRSDGVSDAVASGSNGDGTIPQQGSDTNTECQATADTEEKMHTEDASHTEKQDLIVVIEDNSDSETKSGNIHDGQDETKVVVEKGEAGQAGVETVSEEPKDLIDVDAIGAEEKSHSAEVVTQSTAAGAPVISLPAEMSVAEESPSDTILVHDSSDEGSAGKDQNKPIVTEEKISKVGPDAAEVHVPSLSSIEPPVEVAEVIDLEAEENVDAVNLPEKETVKDAKMECQNVTVVQSDAKCISSDQPTPVAGKPETGIGNCSAPADDNPIPDQTPQPLLHNATAVSVPGTELTEVSESPAGSAPVALLAEAAAAGSCSTAADPERLIDEKSLSSAHTPEATAVKSCSVAGDPEPMVDEPCSSSSPEESSASKPCSAAGKNESVEVHVAVTQADQAIIDTSSVQLDKSSNDSDAAAAAAFVELQPPEEPHSSDMMEQSDVASEAKKTSEKPDEKSAELETGFSASGIHNEMQTVDTESDAAAAAPAVPIETEAMDADEMKDGTSTDGPAAAEASTTGRCEDLSMDTTGTSGVTVKLDDGRTAENVAAPESGAEVEMV